MSYLKKLFVGLTVLILSIGFSLPASAQIKLKSFTQFAESTYSSTFDTKSGTDLEKSIPKTVGNLISIALGLIGVILLVIIVWSGFLWLTAGGNEDQVKKAKTYIRNAIIGMIIALSAYAITSFVVQQITSALGRDSSTPAPATPAPKSPTPVPDKVGD